MILNIGEKVLGTLDFPVTHTKVHACLRRRVSVQGLRKKLAPPPSAARLAAGLGASTCNADGAPYMDGLEFVTLDEIYKVSS